MDIQIDTREKARAIKKILATFDRKGVNYISSKLMCGDYMSFDNPRLIIDRKQNLNEVYQNLCHQHERFRNELLRAMRFGIKLIILVEHGKDIKALEDVKTWDNPRLKETPYAWDGNKLYKVMRTMSEKYKVEWMFCEKPETGSKIIELLRCDK